MKLDELKEKVLEAWEFLTEFKSQIAQPGNFKPEVKQFGDLRQKATWIKALARFEAINAHHSCLDASSLLLHGFNFTPDRWDYEYRHEILDEFLMFPDALDILRRGLEQIYHAPYNASDRSEAHGFFELVEEQRTREGRAIGAVAQLLR
jgi:hypothetical protein